MASGSPPRSRINQFYTSKKKKAPTLNLKPERNEKSVEEKKAEADVEGSSRGEELFESHVAAGKSDSRLVQGPENSELKNFANDFLSLYCSDIHSTAPAAPSSSELNVNDHKRQANPVLLVTPNKRHCIAANHSCLEYVNKMSSADILSGSALKPEVTTDNNLTSLQPTLNKCSNITQPSLDKNDFKTPGSSTAEVLSLENPKSAHGSSIFSPGEAFWHEAIQLADGLCDQTVRSCTKAAEDITVAESQYHSKSSCSLRIGSCDGKLVEKEVARKSLATFNLVGGLQGKHEQTLNEEKSPFPVKHFDFLFEEKNLTPESGLVDRRPRDNNTINHKSAEIKEASEGQEITSASGETSPSSNMPKGDWLDLASWLPSEVCTVYRKKGISKLYPWQVDCLRVEGVLQRRNLVYCASTSAGKSFVAEILMLRRVLSFGKMAVLVLPYVSICAEKAEHLEVILEPLGKHVRSFYGSQGGGALPKDTSVAVCTIEKANSLLNRLLEEDRLSEVGIIVIDELHMVGDRHRGYLLELMLTKLRYASGEGNSGSSSSESSGMSNGKTDPTYGLQIVGMSATMPNVGAVADWLQAALYQTNFRPVPLEEYIKVGNTIYDKKMDIVRTLRKAADLGGKDPDHVVELCNEVVRDGHSVLIFCPSRKGCESTAKHVSRFLKSSPVSLQSDEAEYVDITSAIDALRKCPVGLDPILEETLPFGVAYHHAGLTVEEREVVETCYRKGLVRVLTATSTLAAGVNLPARRVIFRQPRIGRDFIDGTRYKQMSGRAGRTGIDTKGESVLICKPEEIKKISGLLNEECAPLHSCLAEDMNGMTHAILEVVAGGIVQTANDINRYVRCTLLNSTKPFREVVKSAQESLRWLCHGKFLEWNDDTKLYNTTPLGRASFGSSLSPEESLIVLDDLLRAREGFVLASDLHLVYLVTPINVDVEPNWELYYERFMELSALDQSVGYRVGVEEPFLMRMAHGAPVRTSKSKEKIIGEHGKYQKIMGFARNTPLPHEQALRVCKRFFVALILSRLVQEAPVAEVCETFKVARGMVQALQENAGRFASMVSAFCERLGWNDLEGLVSKFQNRVSFGVKAEIVELTTIPYVKGSRARALYKAGMRTPLSIAEASVHEIVKAIFEKSSWAAQESTAQRRMQGGVAKKIKNGARKIVLEKAEEARIAAYSTFKSLGISVPPFPDPPLSNSPGNSSGQGASTTGVDHSIEPAGNPCAEETLCLESKVLETEDKFVTKIVASDVNLANSKDINMTQLIPLAKQGDRVITNIEEEQNVVKKGPINALNSPGGFDEFLDIWDNASEFYFDVHYNRRSESNSSTAFEVSGMAICWENSAVYYINIPKDLLSAGRKQSECLRGNTSDDKSDPVPSDCMDMVRKRWNRISEIMGKKDVRKYTWNLKVQVQALAKPAVLIQKFDSKKFAAENTEYEVTQDSFLILTPIHIQVGIDFCIVSWILWPDEERSSYPNLDKEVKKRLSSEAAAAASQSGRWKNQMRRAAHNGCCRRVAQTRALCSVLWKLLVCEELTEPLLNVEIPLVNILAEMELWGIGVDMEGCLRARSTLAKKLRLLEKEAYKLAGMNFSLYTAADIAHVLYEHLKLPIPEKHNQAKQHPSTDKHCLELLRLEHPVVPVIKEHRTLAKLLNCTLGSICSLSRLSPKTYKHTLHGHWLQTSTATGRLSMEEPNLQCVEHAVVVNIKDENGEANSDHLEINARDYFIPTQDNWLLLTADYSQIELRLMAHFSKDSSLIELLKNPRGDVFSMIAARWTGCAEDCVGPDVREQTKRLVYGILYGMGANTLAEQLSCTVADARQKIQSFKSSFPGVASWLYEVVAECREKGYVKTLQGRKRFLPKIKLGNIQEKSKAERQAVNSICQGSAADIIKIAMINIYSAMEEGRPNLSVKGADLPCSTSACPRNFGMLKDRCRILLQVHDELVLEVDPNVMKDAALLLQTSMEKAALLLVPLHVKLKVGRKWGSLEPLKEDER